KIPRDFSCSLGCSTFSTFGHFDQERQPCVVKVEPVRPVFARRATWLLARGDRVGQKNSPVYAGLREALPDPGDRGTEGDGTRLHSERSGCGLVPKSLAGRLKRYRPK